MKPIQIAIYGAGGFARTVAWNARACNRQKQKYEIVCLISDVQDEHGKKIHEIPVLSLDEAYGRYPLARVVRAIGNPKASQSIMNKAATKGFDFETIIHPNVEMSEYVKIGTGTVILAGSIISTNIDIGKHVQINLNCTIGHDALIEDFSTIAPGVHVSGWVHLGKRVHIGTGAVVIDGSPEERISIGDDVIIGAGACVTKSIPSGLTVVGIPAKPINRRSGTPLF
jgi:sugar O-acyltransferase (sialic acid O-acetyltransferase NeuD family)